MDILELDRKVGVGVAELLIITDELEEGDPVRDQVLELLRAWHGLHQLLEGATSRSC